MAEFQYGSMEEILIYVKSRLIDLHPQASEDNVVISDDPQTKLTAPGLYWWVISPSPQSQVDSAAVDGGGNLQLSVRTRLIVTIHKIDLTDIPDEAEAWFVGEAEPNINLLRRETLKILSLLEVPSENAFFPFAANDPLIPAEWDTSKAKSSGSCQIAFDVEYDENLS